jgi:dihydroxy-acid dehydratase
MQAVLHADAMTVSGDTIGQIAAAAGYDDDEVIRPWDRPVQPAGAGTAVLHGNLAPNGAVLKISAASPHLLVHTGRALVFDTIEDYLAVANDPDLSVTPDMVLAVRGAGPRGYPGMPEIGNLPMPRRLLAAGVQDMVRISDARMSGTAFGTCILHVAPESAVGGPLALLHTGDLVLLDVPIRILRMLVDETELQSRRAGWLPPEARASRGWTKLYVDHVEQADTGADLDILRGCSGSTPPRAPF